MLSMEESKNKLFTHFERCHLFTLKYSSVYSLGKLLCLIRALGRARKCFVDQGSAETRETLPKVQPAKLQCYDHIANLPGVFLSK